MASVYYERLETLLKVEGLNLNLGGRQILRDLNLELKNIHRPGLAQGQVVGLLGPSGMGKTQLFRILSGLSLPDSGTVTTSDGKPITPGRVGVVAQHYPLFSHRTVLSNLEMAAVLGGTPRAEATKESKALLARFGLGGEVDKYPSQLSGGQRQRVAIAQQFLCSEHFVLMDEPFSGLDPLALDAICDFITEVSCHDELTSLIVVTHDIESAVKVCDTLWLLGRERDAAGQPIPGANIRHEIDLIECGLAWKKGNDQTPEFFSKVKEIKKLFATL